MQAPFITVLFQIFITHKYKFANINHRGIIDVCEFTNECIYCEVYRVAVRNSGTGMLIFLSGRAISLYY